MSIKSAQASRDTKKSKRPRLAHDDRASPSTMPTGTRASLTSLPIEILAEVLLNTCSPPTVLAVSYTCSFLYQSLAQSPAASFIWRGVRKTCQPAPLPDPGHCWQGSEADYAAFVFGGGVCEVCRKPTRAMYVSFAAQIRLCGSWYCRRKFLDEFLTNATTMFQHRDRQSIWVPYVESSLCFFLKPDVDPSANGASTWPHNDNVLFRRTDLEKFQLELAAYRVAEQIQAERTRAVAPGFPSAAVWEEDEQRECLMERCHAAVERFPAIMELSASLVLWRCDYDREYKQIKQQNQIWTKSLAEYEGWDLGHLVASEAYGSLQRRKALLLEKIGLKDVAPIRSAIESELLTVQARHMRRKAETIYKEKLTEVKKIYERMRCGTQDVASTAASSDYTGALILPPLNVFCTLPSVRALKGSPDPSAIPLNSTSATINIDSSPLATSLIISDLHTWLVPVQRHLMNLLGYPNEWRSASTRTLPPLKRVTARFFCRRCGEGQVGRGYRREQCLDLRGVCSHVCVAAQGRNNEGRDQEALQEGEARVIIHAGDGNKHEKGKRRGKKRSGVKTLDWRVDVFERDDMAIHLVKTILELTGLSEEAPSTASSLSAKGGVIRCVTCQGWIVMDFDTAIGHVHRHESMQVQLLATSAPRSVSFLQGDASAPNGKVCCTIPNSRLGFERGTAELLLGPSQRARNLCRKVNYGCRHCFLVVERDVLIGIRKPDVGKGARAMDFNGLRSHVKEKHGFRDIRDEDFFCYTSIWSDGEDIGEE